MPKGFKSVGDGLHISKSGKIYSERSNKLIAQGARATVKWFDKTILASHLIAMFFCKHETNQTIVHHYDSDASNNHANNLVWLTEDEHLAAHRALNRVLIDTMHTKDGRKKFEKYFQEELNRK